MDGYGARMRVSLHFVSLYIFPLTFHSRSIHILLNPETVHVDKVLVIITLSFRVLPLDLAPSEDPLLEMAPLLTMGNLDHQ